MNRIYNIVVLCTLFLSSSSQVKNLSPEEFSSQMTQDGSKNIIDVRTPEEFNGDFISSAKNIDWNSNNFESELQKLDKSTPIYIYCLSGGRSTNAARKVVEMGFENVYALDGGLMAWRAKGMKTVNAGTSKLEEMTQEAYENLYKGKKKKILVDFYAEWCIPCLKMKPFLKKISEKMAEDVEIIRINADQNSNLCQSLGISGLPYLIIYQDDQIEWKKMGYIGEVELTKLLKK